MTRRVSAWIRAPKEECIRPYGNPPFVLEQFQLVIPWQQADTMERPSISPILNTMGQIGTAINWQPSDGLRQYCAKQHTIHRTLCLINSTLCLLVISAATTLISLLNRERAIPQNRNRCHSRHCISQIQARRPKSRWIVPVTSSLAIALSLLLRCSLNTSHSHCLLQLERSTH